MSERRASKIPTRDDAVEIVRRSKERARKLTFRDWDGQLRQPILIGTAKLPVSVSPQPGFLHQFTELDTLGFDKPETNCRAYAP